jgi:putative intracellular protease/amidase
MPRLIDPPRPEVEKSPALSLTFRPGDGGIRGRKIAILTAAGVDGGSVTRTRAALTNAGAVVRLIAARLGGIETSNDDSLESDATFETLPSVLFDAVVVPDGEDAAAGDSARTRRRRRGATPGSDSNAGAAAALDLIAASAHEDVLWRAADLLDQLRRVADEPQVLFAVGRARLRGDRPAQERAGSR